MIILSVIGFVNRIWTFRSVIKVTPADMVVAERSFLWVGYRTDGHSMGASGMKMTTSGRIDRGRHIALKLYRLSTVFRVDLRDG